RSKRNAKQFFWATTAAVLVALCVAAGFWFGSGATRTATGAVPISTQGGAEPSSPSFIEETAVKDSLKEALLFEMFTIYVHPEQFNTGYERRLANYWVPAEQGGQDILSVKLA